MAQQNETLFYKMKDLCELIPASRSTVIRLVKSVVFTTNGLHNLQVRRTHQISI
jgi:DNA-binding MurR/RpiR family transcriptional regulator